MCNKMCVLKQKISYSVHVFTDKIATVYQTVLNKWQQHTFACSRNDSTMRRSTRDGLIGRGGTGMLLALDNILPGFCRANSASVCHRK